MKNWGSVKKCPVLRKVLSVERDGSCELMELYPAPDQTVGNCGYASKAAAVRFAWAMLNQDSKSLDVAMQRYERFVGYVADVAWDEHRQVVGRLAPESQAILRDKFREISDQSVAVSA